MRQEWALDIFPILEDFNKYVLSNKTRKEDATTFGKYMTCLGPRMLCDGPETQTECKSETGTDHGGYIVVDP